MRQGKVFYQNNFAGIDVGNFTREYILKFSNQSTFLVRASMIDVKLL